MRIHIVGIFSSLVMFANAVVFDTDVMCDSAGIFHSVVMFAKKVGFASVVM